MPAVRPLVVLVVLMLVTALPSYGQQADSAEVARLREQLDAVSRQLEELQLGREVTAQADTGAFGLAPAASKVYKVRQGVSIGGYGEFLYENFASEAEGGGASGRTDVIDALRAVLYVGYKFNDRFLFNSEIEFEHGSTGDGGEVSLEFGYLEYRASDRFGVRGGLLLVPMGFLNELHEPPTFLGARRPLTEQQIIPSTWRENGIGVFGAAGALAYRAYVVSGLDGAAGFSAAGLRGGKNDGAQAPAEHFAGVLRVDFTGLSGLTIGASGYLGNAGQGAETDAGSTISARTTIVEGHAEYRAHGFDLRGLAAVGTVDDAAAINESRGLVGTQSVGDRLVGWYVQGGYDVLRSARTSSQIVPYVRYEWLNTQDEVPAGFLANPANERRVVSLGAMWKPIPQVAVKGEYQVHRNEAASGVDQINVNLGYLF